MSGNEEQQSTPTMDLDIVMRDGMTVFEGEPEQSAPVVSDETILGPAKKEDETTIQPAPETDKTVDTTTQEPGQKPPVEEPKDFRFTSHEEAEKGYKHAQSALTREQQRVKALEDQLTVLNAEKAKLDKVAADTAFEDFAIKRRNQELNEIDDLDPDDPDYRTKVSKCRAKADKDIMTFIRPEPAPQKPIAPAPAAPKTPEIPDELIAPSEYTKKFISGQGIPQDDPLFWHYATVTPEKDDKGNALTLDAQIAWALGKRNTYLSAQGVATKDDSAARAREKALELQGKEMPMGRTGAERQSAGAENEKPISIEDALGSAMKMRTL